MNANANANTNFVREYYRVGFNLINLANYFGLAHDYDNSNAYTVLI